MTSLAVVTGQLFVLLATFVRNIEKAALANSLTINFNVYFVTFVIFGSIAQPIYGAEGGLNFHMICL